MKNFSSDASRLKLITNILVIGISIIGIINHDFRSRENSTFHILVMDIFSPIERGTLSMKESLVSFVDHYFNLVNVSKENLVLRKEIENLKGELFIQKETLLENERLKKMFQFAEELKLEKVLAQVTGWDTSNEFKVLRVNKGASDGIKVMSPVVTMNGLVGYVYSVSDSFADILTILDQNNRVDAIVSRTRTHGILEGLSGFTCRLKHVPKSHEVEIGDEILTAGLGNIYPKGIKIGSITRVDKTNISLTQDIDITPSVDFQKLEEVLILIDKEEEKRK